MVVETLLLAVKRVLPVQILAFARDIFRRGPGFDEIALIREACFRGERGVMIDVGAHRGGSLVSFLAAGWRVYAFEPDPENRKHLRANVGLARRIKIDPRALSERPEAARTFFRSEVSSGISSLHAFHHSHVGSIAVEVTTLRVFAQENGIDHVDFLKIDVEGNDLYVLKGAPLGPSWARIIMAEFEDRKTLSVGYTAADLFAYLVDHGYRLVISEWEPVEEYGRHHRWKRFCLYPAELSRDAWGNVIAFAREEDYHAFLRQARSLNCRIDLPKHATR